MPGGLSGVFLGGCLIQAKSGPVPIMPSAVCVWTFVQGFILFPNPGEPGLTLEISQMKKAILEKGNWRKIGKPRVVSVAAPSKPVSRQQRPEVQQVQEAAPEPRVTQPQLRPVGPMPSTGPDVERQKVEAAASTIESEPTNLKQTERIDEVNQMQTNTVVKHRTADGHYSNTPAAAIEEVPVDARASKPRQLRSEKLQSAPARRRTRDLQSGMELLGLDFLLSIVENTASDDDLDVTMRKLNFNELIRTDQVQAVDSNALKVYAFNTDGHYDKHIQCEAIKELAARTTAGK